jgi:hypothetical protein
MIKALKKLEIEGLYVNKIKVIYGRPIANIILSGEKLKAFPPTAEVDMGVHSLHFYLV